MAAGFCAAGIVPGDRIVLHLDTCIEIVVAYLACFRVGAIACPMYPHYTSYELERLFVRIQARLYLGTAALCGKIASFSDAIIARDARFVLDDDRKGSSRSWDELRNATETVPKVEADAIAALLATSGSTGEPKLVVHSQRTLLEYARKLAFREIKAGDVVAFTLELQHMPGLGHILACLHHGARLVVVGPHDPDAVLDVMSIERCTYLCGVPRLLRSLAAAQRARPRDLRSLRFAISLADACSPQVAAGFRQVFGVELRGTWSSTEAAGSLSFGLQRGNSSRAVQGTEIRLVDVNDRPVADCEPGEMLVRSSSVALGYWDGPSQWRPFEGGWFRSGDLMREDADHSLWFEGWLKDILVVDGDNVSPAKIENILKSHPAVRDAGVAGVADAETGQRVVAIVELTGAGEDRNALDEVSAFASTRLSGFEVPTKLRSGMVPYTSSGKVDRTAIALLFGA